MDSQRQRALDDLLELLRIPGPPAAEAAVAAHLRARLVDLVVPAAAIITGAAPSASAVHAVSQSGITFASESATVPDVTVRS